MRQRHGEFSFSSILSLDRKNYSAFCLHGKFFLGRRELSGHGREDTPNISRKENFSETEISTAWPRDRLG